MLFFFLLPELFLGFLALFLSFLAFFFLFLELFFFVFNTSKFLLSLEILIECFAFLKVSDAHGGSKHAVAVVFGSIQLMGLVILHGSCFICLELGIQSLQELFTKLADGVKDIVRGHVATGL